MDWTEYLRRPALSAPLIAFLLALGALPLARAQQTFDTPEAGAQALIDAAKANDDQALIDIIGAKHKKLVSTVDREADQRARERFAQAAAERLVLRPQGDDKVVMVVGFEAWPFPVPLVKRDAHWMFDAAAGSEEILNRRIGRNEIAAIEALHAYVAAQRQYAAKPRDGTNVRAFARKVQSTPGKHDGLYWPADPAKGEELSPFGPLIRDLERHKAGTPYNGYYFKVLTGQGPLAPGGAYSYIINGRMVAGFAMVAVPATYGETGIKTFIVNHYDEVYERDLGPDSLRIFRAMTRYDPSKQWALVK